MDTRLCKYWGRNVYKPYKVFPLILKYVKIFYRFSGTAGKFFVG